MPPGIKYEVKSQTKRVSSNKTVTTDTMYLNGKKVGQAKTETTYK